MWAFVCTLALDPTKVGWACQLEFQSSTSFLFLMAGVTWSPSFRLSCQNSPLLKADEAWMALWPHAPRAEALHISFNCWFVPEFVISFAVRIFMVTILPVTSFPENFILVQAWASGRRVSIL